VQTVGQKVGMFFPACGHSIRSWHITNISVGGTRFALVCCPMCGYIQRVMDPAQVYSEEIIYA
jgi:hypothetical protein